VGENKDDCRNKEKGVCEVGEPKELDRRDDLKESI
jgi:hypothetical protein